MDTPVDSKPAEQRLALWRRALHTTISIKNMTIVLLGLAVAGPAFIALLASLAKPGQSWWSYFVEGVGAGWTAPVLIIAITVISRACASVNERRYDRIARRSQSLAVSMFASRQAYYQSVGVPDPMKAATFDVAAYLSGRAPGNSGDLWENGAVAWFSAIATVNLPPLPKSVIKAAEAHEPS